MPRSKCLILFVFIFFVPPGAASAAIFGADDRIPLIPGAPYSQLGRATAVAVLSSMIEPDASSPGTLKLDAGSLSFLCPGEKFANDHSLSYACSGFLVAPDLLVTAGHCMSNTGEVRDEPAMYCEAYGWLFDYQKEAAGGTKLKGISPENFYKCKKIIFAVKDEQAPYRDFALVQLERPVTNRTPLKIADPAKKVAGPLRMIGYPLGTPMKLTSNARVLLDDETRQSLITNLDAFEGNSGSAVFNAASEVIGILVGGTPSNAYYPRVGESCERYNHCDETGKKCEQFDKDTSVFPGFQQVGSEVQRIAPILELLKQVR